MVNYVYSISTDFGGSFNLVQFDQEVRSSPIITTPLTGINVAGDTVTVVFPTVLSGPELTELDNIISSHVALPNALLELPTITITSADSPYLLSKYSVRCDTSGGNITINLPQASRNIGVTYGIRKTNASNVVTIDGYGTELIDGQQTQTLSALNSYLIITSDGTGWSSGSVPTDPTAELVSAPLTNNKGDLISDDGTKTKILPIGTNGQVLTVNTSTSTGLEYTTLNHDTLAGFVANEHIDHSTVSINTGTGLTGGGNITATRTINLALNNLTDNTTPSATQVYLIAYDTGASQHQRILINNLPPLEPISRKFDAYHKPSTNITLSTGSWTNITLEEERIKDPDFSHLANSTTVTINTTDTYMIIGRVTTFISSGTSRSESAMRLVVNGVIIPGTYGYIYNRTAAQGAGTVTVSAIVTLTAGDYVFMQASQTSGSSTIQVMPEATSLTIVKV